MQQGSRTLLSLKSFLCSALGPLPNTFRKLLVGRVTAAAAAAAPLLLPFTIAPGVPRPPLIPVPWFPLPLLPLEGETAGLFAI